MKNEMSKHYINDLMHYTGDVDRLVELLKYTLIVYSKVEKNIYDKNLLF